MSQEAQPSPNSLITPEQIFVAYAEMKSNSSSDVFAKIRAYHQTRWRLISSLFEIPLQKDSLLICPPSYLLDGLASQWISASYYDPLSPPLMGRHQDPDHSIAAAHRDSLARKAASMRAEYREMGGELIVALFPHVMERRISVSRLQELGLPAKKPNATEECLKAWERNFEEEEETAGEHPPDNIRSERMDELKRAEEVRARAEAALAIEVTEVRKLALEQGLASEDEIDGVIYNMPLPEFLKLAASHPKVSRTHFNPALNSGR